MEIIKVVERAEMTANNYAHLVGKVLEGPVFDHKVYGQAYYRIVLGILRKSGYEDRIRLIVPEKLLGGRAPREGEILEAKGQIRTYNKEEAGRSKLEIVVFVKDLKYTRKEKSDHSRYEEDFALGISLNEIFIEGFVCKQPIRRTSPLGREICDLMIAVNRAYNKSDYIPVIAWGRNASRCENLKIGDKVVIEGRIQSRSYRKITEEGNQIIKTAYEVSAIGIVMA